ncbi:MAG TPA: hypothetical protein EYG92_00320 [Lutibacter sp.]|nr:hypothetical protein [Lutibacter sp.]
MKKYLIILFSILLIGCNTNVTKKESINLEKKENTNTELSEIPKVTIIGTFHFNATNDYSSVQIDSIFSDKRQKELDQLINKTKAFNPTKIMVEWEPETKTELDKNLKKYLNNEFVLPQNEIYQIGFRLAKETGIKELFPIDYQMDLGDAKLVEYLKEKNTFSEFENFISDINKYAAVETDYLKSHSITDYFNKMNSTDSDNFNRNIYLDKLSSISNEPGNPLLEYVSNWYKRNIFIMGQIDVHLQKNDRILVLIGAGHKPILKDLYKNRKNIEYIDIQEYLK